jgi:nicotinate phosphoribosyltransferase
LLAPFVRDGHIVKTMPHLHEIRARALESLDALPERTRAQTPDEPYPVDWSNGMLQLRDDTIEAISRTNATN